MRCAPAAFAVLIAVGSVSAGDAAEADPPRPIVPERAWLDLDMDPEAKRYSGRISIDLRILQSLESIPLLAQHLRIDSAQLLTEAGRVLVLRVEAPSPAGPMKLGAPQALMPGTARLDVHFAGEFQDGGIARERDAEGRPRLSLAAGPSGSRGFPMIDAGDVPLVWELSLALPAALQAKALTDQVGIEKVRDGWRRLRFAPTAPMTAGELHFRVQAREPSP